jgi:hypothetical protein
LHGAPSTSFAQYKEVQIHGPVNIRSDVQMLSLPGTEADASVELQRTVQQFHELSGCNIIWQGDLTAG